MTKPAKIILGIITFLPMLFGICCLVYYMLMIKDLILLMPGSHNDPQVFMNTYMSRVFSGPLIMLVILSVITHLGLMIFYIIHVARLKLKSEGEKVMWILLFVFIGTIIYIIYFFMRVVPLRVADTISGQGSEENRY